MLAVRVEKRCALVQDIPKPEPAGECLVRVLLSGICNTDLEIARGYAQFRGTIGHEFVGLVEDSTEERLLGCRVVGEINAGCGECERCRKGDPRHCPTRTVLGIVGRDGAHAQYLRLPVVNLIAVPDSIADEHAVFTEPLAAACGILERVQVNAAQSIVVIGDGKLGLLCAQVLALTGAKTLLVGKHSEKMRIAERRGIETNTLKQAAKRKKQFEIAVEASGSAAGFSLALDLLRPQGTLVLKSTFHGMTEMPAAQIVVDEITVLGSRCGRFAPALDLLKKGAVEVDSLINEEYALRDGARAMKRAAQRGGLKVLLRP